MVRKKSEHWSGSITKKKLLLRFAKSTSFPKDFDILLRCCEKQENIITILQFIPVIASVTTQERLAVLELLYSQFGIQVLCEAAGIPKEGFYSYIKWNKWDNSAYAKHREELRETIQEIFDGSHQRMASMLYFNGVDSVSISKRLGHAQVSTTANIYAHVLEGADQRNADILSEIFLKKA